MRALWPACPPGASRSITTVLQPSLTRAYTAAARPAGPAPTTHEVVQRRLGAGAQSRARRRSRVGRRRAGRSPSGSNTSGSSSSVPPNRPVSRCASSSRSELEPLVVHVVAGQEHA